MRQPHVVVAVLAAALTSCGPRPVSEGPFMTMLLLERWHRADPFNEHTMAGLGTYHLDDRVPYWKVLDEHCGVVYRNWTETAERPPSYGLVKMDIAGRRQVTWRVEEFNMPDFEDPNGELLWDTGDRLHVTSEGAALPAFDFETVVPAKVELTSHDFRALKANELHISRAEPFELRWTPTQGDVLLAVLQFPANNSNAQLRSLWCVFPASTGSFTLSPEVLGNLVKSTPELSNNLYVGGGSRLQRTIEGTNFEVFTWNNEVARVQFD